MKHLFLLLLIFNACVAISQSKTWTHKNNEYGFEITYPATWKLSPKSKTVAFSIATRKSDYMSATASVVIQENCCGYTLDSIVFHNLKGLKDEGQQFSDAKEVSINGNKFYSFKSTRETKIESNIYVHYFGIFKERIFHIRFFCYKSEDFGQYEPVFKEIIESFKID